MSEPFETSISIEATADEVFDHLTDPALLVLWMGDYAQLEPKPGGEFRVDINGVPVRGTYLAVDRPNRVVFSWGHLGSDILPPGTSTVEITLTEHPGPRTLLELIHRNLPDREAGQHATGWPHFLGRLARAAAGVSPGLDPWSTDPPRHDP